MKALDLFCGAGGASMGLSRAGFVVTGVDIKPQPRYPFRFRQADALEVFEDEEWIEQFDLIWASPPCQRYSAGAGKWGTQDSHPHMIPVMREKLVNSKAPFVIENIVPARRHMMHPIMLCGMMFGLQVFRHRMFEASFLMGTIPHPRHGRIGAGFHTVAGHAGGSSRRDGWTNGGTDEWRKAMGIDWMTGDELAESIPPAYAEYIAGQYLVTHGH